MWTRVRGSKGPEQSVANRLQQKAATSGCSSPATSYLARMQADHYHIFRFFSKAARKPGSFKAFPSVWISMMTNWMFSKYCTLPAREWLPALHTVFIQRLAEAAVGLCSHLPTPGSVRITEQGALLCWSQEAPHSLLLLWTSFTAPFSTQKILFRYRLCFGRESCTSNYADEWKAVTKYSTCLESQSAGAGRAL